MHYCSGESFDSLLWWWITWFISCVLNDGWFERQDLVAALYMLRLLLLHRDKSFRNLIISNWNQIVYTIFWLIGNQTDVRLVPNPSENGKYSHISVWFNNNPKNIICVHVNLCPKNNNGFKLLLFFLSAVCAGTWEICFVFA